MASCEKGWRQWVAIYRQLALRGGMCNYFSFSAWEGFNLFSATIPFTIDNHTFPPISPFLGLSLYFGSPYEPQLTRQEAPTKRLEGSCVVTSFCLSVFLSSCLFVFLSVTHVCIREDKCWVARRLGGSFVARGNHTGHFLCPPSASPSLLPHPPKHIQSSEFLLLQQACFEFCFKPYGLRTS